MCIRHSFLITYVTYRNYTSISDLFYIKFISDETLLTEWSDPLVERSGGAVESPNDWSEASLAVKHAGIEP
jgi:hypothetical protein